MINNTTIDRKVSRFFSLLSKEGEETAVAFARANVIESTVARRMGADRWHEVNRLARKARVSRSLSQGG